MARFAIPDFQIANPIYRGSTVTFYTVDPATSARTTTKATLYEATTGTGVLTNPQTLDADGKFAQPCYIEEAVIGVVDGLHVPDHDTGIIGELLLIAEVQITVNSAAASAASWANRARLSELAAQAHRLMSMSASGEAASWAADARRRVDIAIRSAVSQLSSLTALAADATNRARRYAVSAAASAAAALASELAAAASATTASAAAAGIVWKPPTKVATTANITLSGEQTIDGVAVVEGDRVLVKNQTSQSENGIYIVAAGAWSRATDADTWTEIVSLVVTASQGSTNADTSWIVTSDLGGTIGVDNIVFSNFRAVQSASEGTAGIAEIATQTETDTGTDDARFITPLKLLTWVTNKLLATVWTWAKAQRGAIVTVSYNSGSPAIDLSLGNNFRMTFGAGNAAFTVTNIVDGQSGMITLVQDGTGSRTATWSADFLGDADVTLSTAASARDHIPYYTENSKVVLGLPKLNPS